MNKLKRFKDIFFKSLTQPKYYADILAAPFSFSLKYIFALCYFIVLLSSLYGAILFLPIAAKIPDLIADTKSVAYKSYPEGLVVTVKNGQVRTNVDEPYYIDLPSKYFGAYHLVTIDTKATIEDARKYKTLILITKNALVYPEKANSKSDTDFSVSQYKVTYIDESTNAFITKESYLKILSVVEPYIKYVQPAAYVCLVLYVLVGPFIGAFLAVGWHMTALTVFALLLWIISSLMKLKISYMKLLQISLHGITFSLVFGLVSSLTHISVPYSYILPFFMWMVIVFSELKKINYGSHSDTSTTKQSD